MLTGLVSELGEHPCFEDWIGYTLNFFKSRKGKLIGLPLPQVISKSVSSRQRRYYFGLLGLLSDYTGYTVDDFHDGFGKKFRSKTIVIGEIELDTIQSTKNMDSKEMTDYIELVRDWQREYLPECYLPTANEWKEMEDKGEKWIPTRNLATKV